MSYYMSRPVTPYKWSKNEGIQKQEHFNLCCLDSTQFFFVSLYVQMYL